MDIYEKLNLNVATGKEQPGVWVSRLVLFEKLSSEPVIIREVKLSRGLNIVWAQEPDDDNTTTEIKGHSAGKTSFCRLLRYVLGEKTFGTKANQKLIQSALPDGYVGAELHVMGKPWAVIRPFDTARRSYARADVSVEALVAERRGALGHEEYVNQLGLAKLLDTLETATVVRSTQSIEWDHVLAWCTRDQEARFQNIHDWRSTRSESDWPAFKASKADALFVMRTVLGLFLPDELKQEEELAAKVRLKETLESQVAELEREPQFRVNLHMQSLREKLTAAYPDRTDINTLPLRWDQLTLDLARLTEDAARRLAEEIHTAEREQAQVQAEIDEMGSEIAWWEGGQRRLGVASGMASAGAAEVAAGLSELQKLRDRLASDGHKSCPFGAVIINKCDYVTDRLTTLSIPQLQDVQALEQEEASREQNRINAEEQRDNTDQQLHELRRRRGALLARRNELNARMSEARHVRQELMHNLVALDEWVAKQNDTGGFKELDGARQRLRTTIGEIEHSQQTLVALLKHHDSSRETIASIFSEAVRSVLSSGTYDGRVSLDHRELGFYIEHGAAMSGEAIETLSVLLADVACMVYNSASERVLLPGFLLHDSPREADLSRRVYRSFIRFVASLQRRFLSTDACPFQYVITTTTDPPEELRGEEFVKLHLNAGSPKELLFRRSLAPTDSNSTAASFDKEGMFEFRNTGGLDG